MSANPNTIVSLIGPRCSGKTSIGKRLSELLDVAFVDLDEKIVDLYAKENGTVEDGAGAILSALGEGPFRQLEARALRQALAAKTACVLATGGGVVELTAHRRLLRERTSCVRLVVAPDLLRERLRNDSTLRPPLLGEDAVDEIDSVLERRDPFYAEASHCSIDCAKDDIETLARRVQTILASRS